MSLQPIDALALRSVLQRMPSSPAPSQQRPVTVPERTPKSLTDQQLQQAVDDLQKAVEPYASELRFSVDKTSGRTVVKVLDAATGQILKQFPSEEMLLVSKAIEKFRQGLLIDKQA